MERIEAFSSNIRAHFPVAERKSDTNSYNYVSKAYIGSNNQAVKTTNIKGRDVWNAQTEEFDCIQMYTERKRKYKYFSRSSSTQNIDLFRITYYQYHYKNK